MKELRHPIAPELSEENIARCRAMTPGDRLDETFRLTNNYFAGLRVKVETEHPEAIEREVRARVASIHLSRELVVAAYGWDPDLEKFLR